MIIIFYLVKELANVLRGKISDQTVMVAGGPTATFSPQKSFRVYS